MILLVRIKADCLLRIFNCHESLHTSSLDSAYVFTGCLAPQGCICLPAAEWLDCSDGWAEGKSVKLRAGADADAGCASNHLRTTGRFLGFVQKLVTSRLHSTSFPPFASSFVADLSTLN